MKYYNGFTLSMVAFLSVIFQTSATVNPNSTSKNATQSDSVDISKLSKDQCNSVEMEKFRVSVGKALMGNKTRKIRNFIFEVNAVGIKFSLSFKASNNSQDLKKHCSTVKYYRENVLFLSRVFVLTYYWSKNATISLDGLTWNVRDQVLVRRRVCDNPDIRKLIKATEKFEWEKVTYEGSILKTRTVTKHLGKYRNGYWLLEKNKFQFLLKCNYFAEEKFRLIIESELSADINQYIKFKNENITDEVLNAKFVFQKMPIKNPTD